MSGRQMSILIGLVVGILIVSNALYVVNERERARHKTVAACIVQRGQCQ